MLIIATESTVEQSIKMQSQLRMVAHTYNSSILEVEARGVALSPRPFRSMQRNEKAACHGGYKLAGGNVVLVTLKYTGGNSS